MDDLQKWAERLFSLMKRTPEGDSVPNMTSFDENAAQALLNLMPDMSGYTRTVLEHVAQFGAFGLYRVSTTMKGETVEEDRYAIFLGDLSVPQSVFNFDKIDTAIYLGGIPRDKDRREDVIAYLRGVQARDQRYIERYIANDDDSRVARALRAHAERKKVVHAKVDDALRELGA